ncbi:MAG: hypothetical protein WA191_18285 [Telluria sp.]
MNESRRTLLTGMLAGAVMGAVGLPRLSFAADPVTSKPMALLLTGTSLDSMFLKGAEAAAIESGQSIRAIDTPKRAGIVDPARVRVFLQAHRGMRVAGLVDDASYVLLCEIARDAGIALLAEGRHGQYTHAVSRHELRVATGLHGVADMLAAGLVRSNERFAVAERPFGASSSLPDRDWSGHGFDSYRVGREFPLCLHLAGVPLASACAALDLPTAQAEPVVRVAGRPTEVPLEGEWPALLGYALCHAGSGVDVQVRGATQVFLRGDALLRQHDKLASLVSFVMDL